MNETQPIPARCGQCGGALPSTTPEGLCPRCLMAVGWSAETTLEGEGIGPEGAAATARPAEPPLSTARLAELFPALEILEFLGHGGMGAVYKARQPRLDRVVALKLLLPEKQRDPQFADRFAREARALARLNHSKIVAVYDFGEVQSHFYLVMEFVDGLTLRQLLRTRKLAPEEALAIVPDICEALQYAHDQGIVHRDIKPENILIDNQGRVKIADFGIAKIVGGKNAEAALTGGGQVVGTPHYMAPEQIEKPQTVDHRADIYSLGVVFYEMLTGELPLGKFPTPSSRLPGLRLDVRLDAVVLRALEKEPERRYQHASLVKTDVETIAGQRADALPLSTAGADQPGAGRPRSRARRLALAVATSVLVILALILFRGHDSSDRRLRAKVNYTVAQVSVQDLVQALVRQVGLEYDWQKSFNQTDPLCRRWVTNVAIQGKTCQDALDQVLGPVGLRYQLEHDAIVLSRRPDTAPPSVSSGR